MRGTCDYHSWWNFFFASFAHYFLAISALILHNQKSDRAIFDVSMEDKTVPSVLAQFTRQHYDGLSSSGENMVESARKVVGLNVPLNGWISNSSLCVLLVVLTSESHNKIIFNLTMVCRFFNINALRFSSFCFLTGAVVICTNVQKIKKCLIQVKVFR